MLHSPAVRDDSVRRWFSLSPRPDSHSLTIRNASLAGRSWRFSPSPILTLSLSPILTLSPFATLHLLADLSFVTLHSPAICDDSVRRRLSLPHRRRSTVRDTSVFRWLFVTIQSFAPSAMLPATIHSFAPSAMLPATLCLPPSRRLFAFHPQTCNGYFFFFPFELIFVLIFV